MAFDFKAPVKFETTFARLAHNGACARGFNKLLAGVWAVPEARRYRFIECSFRQTAPDDLQEVPIDLCDVLEHNNLDDALWASGTLIDQKNANPHLRMLAATYVRHVIDCAAPEDLEFVNESLELVESIARFPNFGWGYDEGPEKEEKSTTDLYARRTQTMRECAKRREALDNEQKFSARVSVLYALQNALRIAADDAVWSVVDYCIEARLRKLREHDSETLREVLAGPESDWQKQQLIAMCKGEAGWQK